MDILEKILGKILGEKQEKHTWYMTDIKDEGQIYICNHCENVVDQDHRNQHGKYKILSDHYKKWNGKVDHHLDQ